MCPCSSLTLLPEAPSELHVTTHTETPSARKHLAQAILMQPTCSKHMGDDGL